MKWIAVLLTLVIMSGCADDLRVCFDADYCTMVQPYGLFDQEKQDDRIRYHLSVGNIVLSAIFCQTIIVPVVLVGWHLWEPVGLMEATP